MTHKYVVTLLTAAGGFLLSSAVTRGVTLVSYQELGNAGTEEITTNNPLHITVNNVASPYGNAVISQQGSDWVLTFAPTNAFHADATTSPGGGGMSTTFAGKLDFLVMFDAPVSLSASITEGGMKSTTGDGFVSVFAGGVVSEANHAVPLETVGGAIPADLSVSPWSATGSLGSFNGSYSAYKFSIDNDLTAEADASINGGSACITKDSFVITIHTPGGGSGPGVPEPASLTMLGLAVASLVFRTRRQIV